jgi:hypothetical protein
MNDLTSYFDFGRSYRDPVVVGLPTASLFLPFALLLYLSKLKGDHREGEKKPKTEALPLLGRHPRAPTIDIILRYTLLPKSLFFYRHQAAMIRGALFLRQNL